MLYNFGIIAYRCAIGVASLFNEKAALWVKGRKGIWKRMEAVERGEGRLCGFTQHRWENSSKDVR